MQPLLLCLLAVVLVGCDSFRTSLKKIPICNQHFQDCNLLQHQSRCVFPSLSMGSQFDDYGTDDMLFDEKSSKSPMEQFLHALDESIKDETLLKLTLTENESANSSDGSETDDIDSSTSIDWQQVKEWAAINGRLIKTKSELRVQLICYKDKSMKNSCQTKNYTSAEEILPVVSAYIRNAFKKAMLSTKDNDFEIKMRRGQGKFRATSKVSCDAINSPMHCLEFGITDPNLTRPDPF